MKLDSAFYKSFLSQQDRYSDDDKKCIESVVNQLSKQQTSEARPGMLLGKIQSGKTKTFMAIMGLAFDNDFDIAVILTKGTKALAKQTFARIKQEFASHINEDRLQVFDIMTIPASLTPYELNQKLIFIVKKQVDNVDRLIQLLGDKYPHLKERRVLIVDDEADYASVGFKKNDGDIDVNTTTKQLETLRGLVKKAAFLQVTATPYALYLQPTDIEIKGQAFKPIRPTFTELVPVHQDYVGSDYYFEDSQEEGHLAGYLYHPLNSIELAALRKQDGRKVKVDDILNSKAIPGLREAVCNFLIGACIRRLQEEQYGKAPKKFSFLVHTEAGKGAHTWQETIVEALVATLTDFGCNNPEEIKPLLLRSYEELKPSVNLLGLHLPSFAKVFELALMILADGSVMITKVNSEKDIESLLADDGQLKLRTPLNIFIGGQILDRGITIANLIGFYYGRKPNVYQQDTVLQHSRMFGFRPKEDLAVTRFYTEPTIYTAMRRMHESDVALREQLAHNAEQEVVFIQKDGGGLVIPCSPNKVMLSNTTTLKPFKRILPVGFQTIAKSYLAPITKKIDKRLDDLNPDAKFDDPFLVSLDDALSLIDMIEPTLEMLSDDGYEFDWSAAKSALIYLAGLPKQAAHKDKVWCLVRKDRNIKRTVSMGSHAQYADAPDSTKTEGKFRKQFSIDQPMLTLIRQNGREDDEWRGAPFYWPVISAQEKIQTTIFSHDTHVA
ncbi:MAG: Z1 domain-containing protein [Gallionella sp.]